MMAAVALPETDSNVIQGDKDDNIPDNENDGNGQIDAETALEADMESLKRDNGQTNDGLNDADIDVPKVEIITKPTVVEDFFRNFLISNSMHHTLDIFHREWYDTQQNTSMIDNDQNTLQTNGQTNDGDQTITVQNETNLQDTNTTGITNITNNATYNPARIESELIEINNIPDIYFQKQELEEKVRKLDKELNRMETVVELSVNMFID